MVASRAAGFALWQTFRRRKVRRSPTYSLTRSKMAYLISQKRFIAYSASKRHWHSIMVHGCLVKKMQCMRSFVPRVIEETNVISHARIVPLDICRIPFSTANTQGCPVAQLWFREGQLLLLHIGVLTGAQPTELRNPPTSPKPENSPPLHRTF